MQHVHNITPRRGRANNSQYPNDYQVKHTWKYITGINTWKYTSSQHTPKQGERKPSSKVARWLSIGHTCDTKQGEKQTFARDTKPDEDYLLSWKSAIRIRNLTGQLSANEHVWQIDQTAAVDFTSSTGIRKTVYCFSSSRSTCLSCNLLWVQDSVQQVISVFLCEHKLTAGVRPLSA